MGTVATITPDRISVEPGSSAAVTVKISNTDTTVQAYELEVLGAPSEWSTIEPPRIDGLYPGTSTTATVTFHPPRSSAVRGGERPFGLRVRPVAAAAGAPPGPEHDGAGAVPEGVVEVLPFRETTGELVPKIARGRRGARIRAAVDNRGNVPVSLTLKGTDAGELLGIEVKPDRLTVGPGLAAFSDVQIRPRETVWRGPDKTHQVSVTATSAEGVPHAWVGTYLQQAMIPPWLPKAAAAALAGLVLLAGIWFLLLKPVVESAAQAAVAEPLAQAEQLSAAAQDSAIAAEGAAERATGVPGGSSSVGAQHAVRLRVTSEPGAGPRESATAFEPGATFRLTDLVLSNPQGDFGRVEVFLGSEVLFDFALENLRDLDLHFQTAVVAADGEQVGLRVTCRRPGEPPAQDPAPSTCDTALYLGGTLVTPSPAPAP